MSAINPFNGSFLCRVQDDSIMQMDPYTGVPTRKIGVTDAKYNDALQVVAGFKKKLEEAGLLPKQRTPEEMQKEQMDMMQKMLNEMKELKERVDKYERGMDDKCGENDIAGEQPAGV